MQLYEGYSGEEKNIYIYDREYVNIEKLASRKIFI